MNACKPPLQWQTYDITFHKAVVDQGKVVKKARVTVIQNGLQTIDNAEVSVTPTDSISPKGKRADPLPGPRQPGRVSQHLDQAARLSERSWHAFGAAGRKQADDC